MQKIITLFFVLSVIALNAQQKVNFTYDEFGNQSLRELCFGCSARTSNAQDENVPLDKPILKKFLESDVISYYPNPVKEQLYLQWELQEDESIQFISVFSGTGQILKTYDEFNGTNMRISFAQFPTGIYYVVINFTTREQQSIKIIKN